VIAALAALRVGAAYVPIAIDLPEARREAIINAPWLQQLISDAPTIPNGFDEVARIQVCGADLRVLARRASLADHVILPSDAYVAFTSGSTGVPKGAIISQAALVNRLVTLAEHWSMGPQDRVLFKASTAFDVHIWEMLLGLVAGGATVVYPQEARLNLERLARFISGTQVTTAVFVPSVLDALLLCRPFVEASALRIVVCGGEAWHPALCDRFTRAHPTAVLYNGYGPTETTIGVANWPIPTHAPPAEIELGAPMPNVDFLVRSPPATAGSDSVAAEGELWIGGVQVARGYIGDALSDRFTSLSVDGGARRFYKTGDQVRLDTETGRLLFKGRIDDQIKINGVRTELGEIENAVRELGVISNAIAIDLGADQARRICLLYETRSGEPADPTALRGALIRILSNGATQVRPLHQSALPILPSGKVDRTAARRAALEHVLGLSDGRR
jgi:amino acid adenylation domain-containing protein